MIGLTKPGTPPLPPTSSPHAVPGQVGDRYALAALQRECDDVATAPEGTRNHTLNRAAFNLGQLAAQGLLDRADIEDNLRGAALVAGLPQHEINATLASGATGAATKPRAPVQLVNGTPPGYVLNHPEVSAEQAAERRRMYLLRQEVERQRARREAEKILNDETATANFRIPPYRPTLTAELAIPDEPVAYTIDQVLPVGGNVLLASQFKAGKTTLVNQFAKSLADQTPFLGTYDVAKIDGRIALFNYEVNARQYRRWLRDVGVTNTDQVVILNLRGFRLPITTPYVEEWVVTWLVEHDVKAWVVDPFARAFVGAGRSENDNTEVSAFLDTLDVIKARAGVADLILATHTGRAEFEPGAERARGATRLDDWADVRWLLTVDESGTRFFRATGRDVDVDEVKLTFDATTRTLSAGGGDRAWERRRHLEALVVAAVEAQPGIGISALRHAVRDLGGRGRNETIDQAAEGAARGHLIQISRNGNGRITRHYPSGAYVIPEGD